MVVVSRALVLGGGGNTGFAWQWGMITGLHDAGVDLEGADLVVGTSGGAMAAAQLTSGAPPRKLLAVLGEPPRRVDTRTNEDNRSLFTDELRRLIATSSDGRAIRVGLGAMALAAATGTEKESRQVVSSYLMAHDWPRQRLVVTAVDAHSGELATFDRDSGVPLVDALAASCAIPGVWPPMTIDGHRYIDGTVRSPTNADVAAGADRIVVLAPMPDIRGLPGAGIEEQTAPVRASGQVVVITPNERSRAAMGRDMLSLSRQGSIATAGLAQTADVLDAVGEVWRT